MAVRARCAVTLAPAPHSPAEARAFARRVLDEWGLDRVEDAVLLVVSELATNVVLHARTAYDLVLERRGDVVRVTLLDDAVAGPVRRRTGLRAATGRGLGLVETVSRAWGRTDEPALGGRAKGVWADVSTEPGAALDEGALYGTDWLAELEREG